MRYQCVLFLASPALDLDQAGQAKLAERSAGQLEQRVCSAAKNSRSAAVSSVGMRA